MCCMGSISANVALSCAGRVDVVDVKMNMVAFENWHHGDEEWREALVLFATTRLPGCSTDKQGSGPAAMWHAAALYPIDST